MLVQGDGELPTISNSVKKCFIFITFISMHHVGKNHLNLYPIHHGCKELMHFLIPLCNTSLKRYFFPCKLKPVDRIEHMASVINRSRVRVLKKIVEVGLMQNKLFF